MRKKAYRATDVKNVELECLLSAAPEGPVWVGLDIGKFVIYVVIRWHNGHFERPWKVLNPSELELLAGILRKLGATRTMIVALESTGTYGDPLRARLAAHGLTVHRVGGKAASDYAEVFDGVPSQHDGKDAAILAELAAFGKSQPWPSRELSASDSDLTYWVNWLDAQQSVRMLWVGRLESLLARHWPEATRLLELTSVTLLRALAHYGGPAGLAADPEAAQRLARWGRRKLESAIIQKVIASAAQTAGASQNARDRQWLRQCATLALAAYRETQQARRQLQKLARNSEILQRQAQVVGAATACVLWVALGDPRDYPCPQAYRKAMGLNLKERSSGRHKGLLKITKRGPSSVRKWLYFSAMRQVKAGPVRRWHEAKKARDKNRGLGSLIAVARKLALALHVVAVKGVPFEPWRLFPGRSLARRNLQASSIEPVGA